MEVTPVRHYQEPAYPSTSTLRQHPALLQHVPSRWRANRYVLTALSWVVALGLSVRAEADRESVKPPARVSKQPKKPAYKAGVAPLFEHGDGRGTFGCVAVASPVFLSEEEARQVVVEEARKAGLDFKSTGSTIEAQVPFTEVSGKDYREEAGIYDRTAADWGTRKTRISTDGEDRSRHIGYVYVSEQDFDRWERANTGTIAFVSSKDLKGAADRLVQGLKDSPPPMALGVFYDPMAASTAEDYAGGKKWQEVEANTRIKARELLRKQVRDFIGWLKAQGVI